MSIKNSQVFRRARYAFLQNEIAQQKVVIESLEREYIKMADRLSTDTATVDYSQMAYLTEMLRAKRLELDRAKRHLKSLNQKLINTAIV